MFPRSHLEQKLGPEEDVEEPQKDKGAQAGQEGASQVQVLACNRDEFSDQVILKSVT